MKSLQLSIVVITYNCEDFLLRFLTELTDSLEPFIDYELLFFDNASSDRTVSLLNKFPQLKVNISNVNLGFAKANNILIKQARYQNILLLNPDVFGFNKGFWHELFQRWDHKNPLFIKLKNPDDSFQDCIGEVVSVKRIFHHYFKPINYAQITSITEVEMGIMAFMLATLECFNSVGLLSEDYHMYAEDMDWCYRARKKKYRILYDPNLSLTHIGSASAKKRWIDEKTQKIKYEAERIFIGKHFKGFYKLCMLLLNSIKLRKIQ